MTDIQDASVHLVVTSPPYWQLKDYGAENQIGFDDSYRLADPREKAAGIDGFIGSLPVSIKPETYKTKDGLPEDIDVGIDFYKKVKDGIVFNLERILKNIS